MVGPTLPPQFREQVGPPKFREQVEPPKFWEQVEPPKRFGGKWKWLALLAAVVVVAVGVGVALVPDLVAQNGDDLSGQSMILAQQQRPPQQTAPTPPARPGAAQQQQPAQQQPAPAVPERSERIVQDSWTINCVQMKATDAKKTCSAVLQVVEQQNKRVVFAWVIGRSPEGAITTVFQTPNRVLLQKGVELKIGNAAPRKANYVVCTNQACEAALPMDDAMIREAMAAVNANAVATITLADGRGVNFTMPIKGIDKVLAAIR